VAEAFFQQLSPLTGGVSLSARFLGTDATSGPWSDQFMHAGPPSALVGHLVAAAIADPDMGLPSNGLLTRFSADILRPIPVGEVSAEVRTLRSGARIGLVEVQLRNEEHTLLSARCWVSRRAEVAIPRTPLGEAPTAGEVVVPDRWGGGYLRSVEWSWVEGIFHEPGPATVWTRALLPLLPDTPWRPVERVLLIADSGNGISAVADPRRVTFVNTDLTVHLVREPVGESIWMAASTALDPQGVGLASSTLGDRDGGIGTGAQSLFVAPTAGA